MKEKWVVYAKRADFNEIAKTYNIDPVIARIIRNRDIVETKDIKKYLSADTSDLYNPSLLKDMNRACSILSEKILNKKKIRIISDYDVDGVVSNYILLVGLTRAGAIVDYEIPDRIKDGYGINVNLIKAAFEDGIDTIITCDNGIAAIEEINYAKNLGMTVIVTDHHDVPYTVLEDGTNIELSSDADAIVNPKQVDCQYPCKVLCGSAVALKVMQGLFKYMNLEESKLDDLYQFVAIATVCDVVDLVDENRILVKIGLKQLKSTQSLGLMELMKVNSIDEKSISSYHLGFVIGPCINASGRLETAKKGLELLLCNNIADAQRKALELKQINDARKEMTQEGVDKAIEIAERDEYKNDYVLVINVGSCHESLAGIIAGRVREKYNKPVLITTNASEGLKGSGRSIDCYNMFLKMSECRELLSKFGGHPMAAGFSLKEENLNKLRIRLNKNCNLTAEDLTRKIYIDAPMPISYLSKELIRQLELIEPFGKGNEKPLFAQAKLKIKSMKKIGKHQNMLKLSVADEYGCCIDALLFSNADEFLDKMGLIYDSSEIDKAFQGRLNDIKVDLAYYPSINVFNGMETIQIIIQGYIF